MTLDDGCINEEGNVGPAPRVCLDCHGELMRATDVGDARRLAVELLTAAENVDEREGK